MRRQIESQSQSSAKARPAALSSGHCSSRSKKPPQRAGELLGRVEGILDEVALAAVGHELGHSDGADVITGVPQASASSRTNGKGS